MRILSLLPSATETVVALGLGPALVGRSEECDYPPSVRSLPAVMKARTLDAGAPSADIDQRVRSMRARDESLYTIDWELLRSLAPDVILTQDLCRVCSVTPEEVVGACRVAGLSPKICTLSPTRLSEVWATVREIGSVIGAEEAGRELAHRLEARVQAGATTAPGRRPRIAVVEWLDPPILSGLWTPDMIDRAGGVGVGPTPGALAYRTTWTELGARRPDLLLLSPCSFGVERTRRELAGLPDSALGVLGQPPLGTWVADEAYFSRPGPRLASGVELLASLLRGSTPREAPMPVQRWDAPATARAS